MAGSNIDKLKERYEETKNPKKGRKSNAKEGTYRPKEGLNKIRLIPAPDGDSYRPFKFHYIPLTKRIGNRLRKYKVTVLCPLENFGEDCPLCEYGWHLWNEANDRNDKDGKKEAQEILPKKRYFSNVIDREEEEPSCQVYGYGKKAFEEFYDHNVNPDWGDPTDTDNGYDFTLKYTPADKTDNGYAQTKLTPNPTKTSLAKTKKEEKRILDSFIDLDEYAGPRMTRKEVQEVLDQWLGTADDSPGESKYGNDDGDGDDDVDSVDSAIEQLAGS